MDAIKLPKGLVLAHINISSLRDKTQDLFRFLQIHKIDILAISEISHLDDSFKNSEVNIVGFSLDRHDRNRFGGGVAILVLDHLPDETKAGFNGTGY